MKKQRVALVIGLILAMSGCGNKAEMDGGGNPTPISGKQDAGGASGGEEGMSPEGVSMGTGEEGNPGSQGEASGEEGNAGSGMASGEEGDAGGGSSGTEGNTGSGGTTGTGENGESHDTPPDAQKRSEVSGTEASQGGPYGRISVTIPEGWTCDTYPVDSEEMVSSQYGMHFAPAGAAEGYIELGYVDFFGVCGTGLESREETIGGCPANVGTYDGHPYWDFVHFRGDAEGVVAITYSVESWWEEYEEQAMEILDTLAFEPDVREGGVGVYDDQSEDDRVGLYFYLEKITPTGATLVYNQHNAQAPEGKLQDGDDFVMEVKCDGKWEEVPVTVDGEYGFNAIAYTIAPEEITKRELNWEWLYGALEPGEYRIRKMIQDVRGTADYDEYELSACFLLN